MLFGSGIAWASSFPFTLTTCGRKTTQLELVPQEEVEGTYSSFPRDLADEGRVDCSTASERPSAREERGRG